MAASLACAVCHSAIHPGSRYCSVCGTPVGVAQQPQTIEGSRISAYPPVSANPSLQHPGAASGFARIFGLDPRIALLTIVVDSMLFGGQVLTLGTSALLSVPAGIALGFITYKAQRSWYGDDRDSALIKGLIVALLTAIPTSLPGFLTIPSGIVGLVDLVRRKRLHE